MSRSHKALGFLLVAIAGIWGCARSSPGGSTGGEGNPSLAAKAQRLEEDFRAAAAARDQLRQKLIAAEERAVAAEKRAGQLQTQLDGAKSALASAVSERDGVRAERDTLMAQYDTFRKGIKNLLGQAESALNNPGNTTPTVTVGAQAPPAGSALSN